MFRKNKKKYNNRFFKSKKDSNTTENSHKNKKKFANLNNNDMESPQINESEQLVTTPAVVKRVQFKKPDNESTKLKKPNDNYPIDKNITIEDLLKVIAAESENVDIPLPKIPDTSTGITPR